MRAAVLNRGEIVVRDDVPEPTPTTGQVLVQVRACGICGSDLHFAQHAPRALELGKAVEGLPQLGAQEDLDLDRDVYMGHEFAAEVLEAGPDTQTLAPGTLVTSVPVLAAPDGIRPIVYSNVVAGGYGERMLLTAPMLLEVPNGLDASHAALTEPMAVGLHAVNRSRIEPRTEGALVLGCGPVGLAVIAALKLRAVEPIVAADFSPARRTLALTMGAHEAVDPQEESGWAAYGRVGKGRSLVVFEAIGVPGVIDDTLNPFFGIAKELNVQFALGYDAMEFAASLRSIAEGEIDVVPMVTAEVGLDDVPWAFGALRDPEEHCKIIVTPSSSSGSRR